MKLTVIFLLCFVSATYQHPQHHPSNYRIFYEPRLPSYYPLQTNQQSFFHDYDFDNEADSWYRRYVNGQSSDFPDTEMRAPVSGTNNPQSKLFGKKIKKLFAGANVVGANLIGANVISQLLSNNNNQIPQIPIPVFPTFTSTVLKTTTLTVTTASIKSCIDGTQFAIANGVRSTQACSRKRRGIDIEEMETIDALAHAPVEPLEASVVPVSTSSRDGRSDDQAEIASSLQELAVGDEDQSGIYRQKRNFVITTVTATITAYSFTASPVVKSFTFASSVVAGGSSPAGLLCLPVGYNVC